MSDQGITKIQEAEQNAQTIVAYWDTLVKGGIEPDYAIQILTTRLVVSEAINNLSDEVEYVKNTVNEQHSWFSGTLREISGEISGLQDILQSMNRMGYQLAKTREP